MTDNKTCFPQIEFNEVIQDKIVKSIFDKLSTCTDEKDLRYNIDSILEEKSNQGLISLDAVRKTSDFKAQSNLLLECAFAETTKLVDENIKIDAAYVVSGITKFICNPPTFDFPSIDLSFQFSLKELFIKLLFDLIDLLMQLIMQIIQQILNILLNICETNFEGLQQGYENILNIVTTSFQKNMQVGLDDIKKTLDTIFHTFGFNSDGTIINDSRFPTCDVALDSIRPVNDFLNDLSMMLTPYEICSLFEGYPSRETVNLANELLGTEYPLLQTRLSDDYIIRDFFFKIGQLVPVSVCRDIRTTYENNDFATTCSTELSDREAVKLSILKKNGHTEEQSKALLQRERERYSKRFKDLGSFIAKFNNNPDSVFDGVSSNIFCKDNKAGSVSLKSIPSMVNTTKKIANSFFDVVKSAHYGDSLNIQDIYFKKATKRVKRTRFATTDNPVIINGYTMVEGDTIDYTRVKALGNPIFYTNKEEYALTIAYKNNPIEITFDSSIQQSIYNYILSHFDAIGNILNSPTYSTDDFISNDYDQQTYINVYGMVITPSNLVSLSEKIYNLLTINDNSLNIYNESNNITKSQIVQFLLEDTVFSEDDNINSIISIFVDTQITYSDSIIEVYKPRQLGANADGKYYFNVNTYRFNNSERDLEQTLEQVLDHIENFIYTDRNDAKISNLYKLNDYLEVTRSIEQPPTIKNFPLSDPSLNVEDDGKLDNRWIADINKINAANATEEQPLGILEEVQQSDLIVYQAEDLSFMVNDNVQRNGIKYISLLKDKKININVIEDNSVLNLDKIYREKNNISQIQNSDQQSLINSYLAQEHRITLDNLKNKELVYGASSYTTGPFKQYTSTIISEVDSLLPNRINNISTQIQLFDKIDESNQTYYEVFAKLLHSLNNYEVVTKSTTSSDTYKTIKEDILIIPFERIIGINKVKKQIIDEYINDPCAISQNSKKSNEIPLFNKYLIKAFIQLLVRTHILRTELKDLLSLTKINPYSYAYNDDTYIEFLLQTLKQEIKRLSGTSNYFYENVISYIEQSVDNELDLNNKLIDPITNQVIDVSQTLTTDFKIRFFIKSEYADMLPRLESMFVHLSENRETNLNKIKQVMRETINIPPQYETLYFEFLFPISKLLSIIKISNIRTMISEFDKSNDIYMATLTSIKRNIITLLNTDPNCNPVEYNFNFEGIGDFSLEMIKQFILRAPIEIVKGLAESFDPNIRIANPIRNLTEQFTGKNLPCLPFSLALLPIGTVPFGIGPPILPPWGFAYLGIDTAEFLLSPQEKSKRLAFAFSKNKFNKLTDELFERNEDNC